MAQRSRAVTRTALATVAVASAIASAVLITTAAAAAPRISEQDYLVQLWRAFDDCRQHEPRSDDASAMIRCVGELAGPNPRNAAEIDLFRVFTNCLAEAAGGDSMYPGIDPAEVNACLEDWGVY